MNKANKKLLKEIMRGSKVITTRKPVMTKNGPKQQFIIKGGKK